MNRAEFEALRDLRDKVISADIVFLPDSHHQDSLVFDRVEVANAKGYKLLLNGTYVPGVPSVKFNFVVFPIGPICRIEVNGVTHRPVGRTHKHSLRTPQCPENGLPFANAITDLDISTMTVAQIWESICRTAGIVHTGRFQDPG
jgi:hypothetical protein